MSIFKWDEIMNVMTSMGYRLIDLHEHEFSKEFIGRVWYH
ncbi:hypothetical protein B4166_0322 [Caldibacillus thermoamylovorans]|uniref:Uncharacterized protein n=1 Tax=Caldibacillus thermoamylovorans TaxID=35841 RepID=A0ABD4A4T9_9BACI|nr:hypothetical protein B4166_0322 [Caldibacillus thermoamylovorans]KIO71911.1 hypothetical protein B4167_0326 [Caldibacillus thermoamylovorans]